MALKKAEVLAMAKCIVLSELGEKFQAMSSEQVDDFVFAVPVEVDGAERWVEISLVAKDTMTSRQGDKIPYDPFEAAAQWQDDKADKEAKAAERQRKHDEAVARAEARKAARKAKAEAKAKVETEDPQN